MTMPGLSHADSVFVGNTSFVRCHVILSVIIIFTLMLFREVVPVSFDISCKPSRRELWPWVLDTRCNCPESVKYNFYHIDCGVINVYAIHLQLL